MNENNQETHKEDYLNEPDTKDIKDNTDTETKSPKKTSWWKKLNQKLIIFSALFLVIGFVGGYQVAGMNRLNNGASNETQQTNGKMQRGEGPGNGETPPERPDGSGEAPDVNSGASENQEEDSDDQSANATNSNNADSNQVDSEDMV